MVRMQEMEGKYSICKYFARALQCITYLLYFHYVYDIYAMYVYVYKLCIHVIRM